MMRTTPVLVAIALEFSAAFAAAQTCDGTASFSGGPVQLSAGLTTANNDKAYGVGMRVGRAAGPFAAVGLSRFEYEGFEGAGTGVSAGAGYAINLNAAKTGQFCPSAGFSYGTGPDYVVETTRVHTSGRGIGFGGSLGGVVRVAPTFDIVPWVGASYNHSRETGSADGGSISQSSGDTGIGVGAGFVIMRVFTLLAGVYFACGG